MREIEIHFEENSRVLFLALLLELVSTWHFYTTAPLCENQECHFSLQDSTFALRMFH